jgi:uncharacterized protein
MATTAHYSSSGEFSISIHDLRRQPGEMLAITRSFPSPERIGIDVIAIEPKSEIAISGKVESVSTGVLVTCQIESSALGECVRCLDPINLPIRAVIQELFYYCLPVDLDEDEDEPLLITDEQIDLLPPIRDAIILDLPLTPHCSEKCRGLCPECGEKLGGNPDNPEGSGGHHHERVDPRWAKLRDLPKLEE